MLSRRKAIQATIGAATLLTAPWPERAWAGGPVRPSDFGAVGDGRSRPAGSLFASLDELQAKYPFAVSLSQELDWLAWQAALNAGGEVASEPLTYKMCNGEPASQQPLVIISGQSWVRASGALLDFSALSRQPDDRHYVANHDFADATGWSNASIHPADSLIPAVFGKGAATCTDSADRSRASFYQFGQRVTLEPGNYRAVCTFTATRGDSYAAGNIQPPHCSIGFFANSPGDGANFAQTGASGYGLSRVLSGPVTQRIQFEFSVRQKTTAWLTFTGGGYANFTVTELDIVRAIANAAILATRDGAARHYSMMHPVEGVDLIGPGRSVDVTGVLYSSFHNIDGALVKLRDCAIHGFGTGVSFKSGAYLVEFDSVHLYDNGCGILFETGARNAGENMRFNGGGIFNSGIGIDNPAGAEFTLNQTALDFCSQAIVRNAGRIELHGVHAELRNPEEAGKPLFECIGRGRILWFGGMFLGAGEVGAAAEPPLRVEGPLTSIEFYGTEIYNLSSSSGYAASGAGTIRIRGWQNSGNPNLGLAMISAAPAMDVLGGAGSFEPVTGVPFSGRDTSDIALAGGMYPDPGAVVRDRWNSSHYRVAVSGEHARSGGQSLKVSKTGVGKGTSGQLALLVPLRQGADALGEMWFLFPHRVGDGHGTALLYTRLFWSQVIGADSHGRPVFGNSHEFKGEVNLEVPLAGSPEWVRRRFGTTYTTAAGTSAGAPEWATHLALLIDHTSIPEMSYYIDGFAANVL